MFDSVALMTSAEAASALDVSVKTVTRMVADERLKPVKRLPGPRGAFLFDPAQVKALAASRVQWSASTPAHTNGSR